MQGEIADSSGAGASPVRFGSAEFAAEVLPQAHRAALTRAAAAVGHDNAVSVLVRAAPGRPADSFGEDAVVRLFTFQASSDSHCPPARHHHKQMFGLTCQLTRGCLQRLADTEYPDMCVNTSVCRTR